MGILVVDDDGMWRTWLVGVLFLCIFIQKEFIVSFHRRASDAVCGSSSKSEIRQHLQ